MVHPAKESALGNEHQIRILGANLNESLELAKVLQMTVDAACQLIPAAQRAVFHLLDDQDQVLKPITVSGAINHSLPSLSMRIGEGIAGNVILDGALSNVADVRLDARFAHTSAYPQVPLSLLVVPVQRGSKKYGTISVQSEQANAFTKNDEVLLTEFAQYASIAIENAWLYEQANQHRRWAEALLSAAAMMTRSLEPETVLDAILDQVAQVIPACGQIIMLLQGTEAVIVRQRGLHQRSNASSQSKSCRLPISASPFEEVIQSGMPFISPETFQAPEWIAALTNDPLGSYAVLPLITADQVSGFLVILSDQKNAFYENLVFQLRIFADHASFALYNAQLHAELKIALQKETELRNHLLQQEHLAAMGRMVSLIAHALNNPLQALVNSIYLVSQEIPLDSPAHEYLRFAQKDIQRLSSLIAQLRQVYRPGPAEKKTALSLRNLLKDTYNLIAAQLPAQNIEWEMAELPEDIAVEGIQSQLIQLLLNICLNAIEAMKDGARGKITIQWSYHLTEAWVGISIQDNGKGIPESDLPKIFDPYFSTKSTKIGLGLTVCNEIIRQHDGKIEVQSTLGSGTTVTVWLPYKKSFQAPAEGE